MEDLTFDVSKLSKLKVDDLKRILVAIGRPDQSTGVKSELISRITEFYDEVGDTTAVSIHLLYEMSDLSF
jgi:hypothetical protein